MFLPQNVFNHNCSGNLEVRHIPVMWKKAVSILIHKKGDSDKPENFHPITLEPVSLKVFTSLLGDSIYGFLEENNYIECQIQKGFMQRLSGTLEHTYNLSYLIDQAKIKQRSLTVTLLDLKNAFVCKKYYIDTLVKEFNINNPTYISIDDSFETIVKSHNQFITSVGLEISEEDQNLPYLYWTPKLHKSPYKHRFIAGSSKCTTKDLSCLLTKVLSTIKDGLVRYCNTKTSHNDVNNMWIPKNSTSLLSSLDQLDLRTATSVQTSDFSTLYTSIQHDLLKSRINNLVHNAFRKKDGSVRHTHIKVTRAKGYFTHDINGCGDNMYTANNICKMIEFLTDNIFVQFGGRLFRQAIGIPMGTNCAPLFADLSLYFYENESLDNMIRSGHRRLARSFNLCYRYIDDLIVFNNRKFLDYLKEIYPSQLTV